MCKFPEYLQKSVTASGNSEATLSPPTSSRQQEGNPGLSSSLGVTKAPAVGDGGAYEARWPCTSSELFAASTSLPKKCTSIFITSVIAVSHLFIS